jgi:hypothetical protein
VRADVFAGGKHFSANSEPFTIRGSVRAVTIGHASARGQYAVAIASGTIERPADGYVLASVETSPSQAADMDWSVACVRGTAASSLNGSATDGGPGTVAGDLIVRKVRMSMRNAESCSISFSAQLHGTGSLKIDLLGNSRI